jgi:hypothetical protein
MTEEELMNHDDPQDPFWQYVEELAAEFQVPCEYILEEFLIA